jgi:hypothetical protein
MVLRLKDFGARQPRTGGGFSHSTLVNMGFSATNGFQVRIVSNAGEPLLPHPIAPRETDMFHNVSQNNGLKRGMKKDHEAQ